MIVDIRWPGQSEEEYKASYDVMPLGLRIREGNPFIYAGDDSVYQKLMDSAALGNGWAFDYLVQFLDLYNQDTTSLKRVRDRIFDKLVDDSSTFCFWKALVLFSGPHYERAIAMFQDSLRVDPPEFHVYSECMLDLGDLDQLKKLATDTLFTSFDGESYVKIEYAKKILSTDDPVLRQEAVRIAVSVGEGGNPVGFDIAGNATEDLRTAMNYWTAAIRGGLYAAASHLVDRCINDRQYQVGLETLRCLPTDCISSAFKAEMEGEIYRAMRDFDTADKLSSLTEFYHMDEPRQEKYNSLCSDIQNMVNSFETKTMQLF